jgi:peptide/nickel transport system permease protein
VTAEAISAELALETPVARHSVVGRLHFGRVSVTALLAAAFLLLTVAAVFLGPFVWDRDTEALDLTNRFAWISTDAPLGTDDYGRDILIRMLDGGRRTFIGALLILLGSSVLGLCIGAMAGAAGGWIDSVLGRLIDVSLGLPPLVIAMGIVGALGKSYYHLLLALVLAGWPWYARLYRSLFIKERSRGYVLAAISLGVPRSRILWRHIGPNVIGPVLVIATVNLGGAMLSLASLSFLGLGVQAPTPEWGAMVNEAKLHFQTHPWLMVVPGLAVALCVLSVNILGDALRDALDPRPASPQLSFGLRKRKAQRAGRGGP